MSRKRKNPLTPADWQDLPDEELLRLRIRDLGLRIEDTVLEGRIARLYEELDARDIGFHPPCYLADEWLCPDRVPMIGIPFWLAHPRLVQLERSMMLEVEGGTDVWCMRLLRHEAGHALNYAYRLFARTRWRELFGAFTEPYTRDYAARPYSRRYVIHLEDHYAQAHPDEDFAETFAVWLDSDSNWERRYRDWPALKKLRYVDHLMRGIAGRHPAAALCFARWSADRMLSTLGTYYDRRRRYATDDFPGFYDPGLQKIFTRGTPDRGTLRASRLLRRHRRHIVNAVVRWTGDRKYDVDKLLRKLAARCDDMNMIVSRSEQETLLDLVAFVTSVMANIELYRDREHRL